MNDMTGSDTEITLKEIVVKHNSRKQFSLDKLKELSKSMAQVGLIHPITVFWSIDEKKYVLVAGERRMRAAKILKWRTIDARVCEDDAVQTTIIQMEENLNRDDLNPLEEADQFKLLLGQPVPGGKKRKNGTVEVFTGQRIATMRGKSAGWISQRIALLDLPQPIQMALRNDEIPFSYVRELLAIPSQEKQMQEFKKYLKSGKNGESIKDAAGKAKAQRASEAGEKKRGHTASEEDTGKPNVFRQGLEEALMRLQTAQITPSNKTRLREGIATSYEKIVRTKSDDRKQYFKGMLVGLEWAAGMRDKIS